MRNIVNHVEDSVKNHTIIKLFVKKILDVFTVSSTIQSAISSRTCDPSSQEIIDLAGHHISNNFS